MNKLSLVSHVYIYLDSIKEVPLFQGNVLLKVYLTDVDTGYVLLSLFVFYLQFQKKLFKIITLMLIKQMNDNLINCITHNNHYDD